MAKNYIQPGDTLTVMAPADVVSGGGVLVGNIFGVAQFSAKNGEPVEIKTTGVFELDKVSAQAWATVGLEIYWDASAKKLTSVAGTNKLVAVNTATAENPSGTGVVRLNGVFGMPSIAQMTAGDA